MKRREKVLFTFLIMICMFWVMLCPCEVQAATKNPEHELFEADKDAGYPMETANKVTTFSYGETSIGKFSISGNIVEEGEYSGYVAYGVNDVLSFSYSYDGNYNSDKKTEWNVISDDKKKVGNISLDTKVKEGVVLIQKSSDGKTWSNITEPKNEYFAKKTGDNSILYTTSLDEVKQGTYYRIIVAYSMKIKVGTKDGWLFFDSDIFETKEFVEKYQFFVCADNNQILVKDSATKASVSAGKSVQYGFYIDMNGSSDIVKVSKNGGYALNVANYDSFTEPGEYKITVTTKLGKTHTQTIKVSEGLYSLSLTPKVYECKKSNGFTDGTLVSGNTSYGIRAYSELKVAQNAGYVTTKSTYNGFDAYGINGDAVSIFMTLKYPLSLNGSGWSVVDSSWGKKEKEKISGVQTGEMGTGALIIQTSSTGKDGDWKNADKERYNVGIYTTDYGKYYNNDEEVLIYTPDGNEVLRGVYVRVLYAYQVYNKADKKYIDCLETYEFYLCSNELGAVTFHNSSLADSVEEMFGDEDENVVEVYKQAESLISGSGTFTGFKIDTSKNPTVKYTVKKNGVSISSTRDNKYSLTGRYDVQLQSAVGDVQTTTIFVDRSSNEEALKNYFGDNFISGKRVYAEGEYPVYEGGENTTYNLMEVSEFYLPISGQICNVDTGDIIELEASRAARKGSLTVPGRYIATFTTGASVGDVRTFKFNFSIIEEGTAPGPRLNQEHLLEYAQTNISDVYPVCYAVTYQSAAKGYITLVFRNKEDAIEYAYSYEKGMVEQQEDGTYRYNGSLSIRQKEKYDSAWDLTDAMYYFAEQAVQTYYFDLSEPYTYRTLTNEIIEATPNLRTLELERSVVIFADEQRLAMALPDALPIISEKPYLYLNPGLKGTDVEGVNDFEFVKDKYGCDSYTVVITDCNGNTYPIEYNKGVGAQLREAGCPSGIVTITETTIFGDSNSYEAVYIETGVNTATVRIQYYDTGKANEIVVTATDAENTFEVDVFTLEQVNDVLDPYSLVLVSKDGKVISFYGSDQVMKDAWSEAGEYTIKIVNRLGGTFSFKVIVRESDYSVITFVGEGTEEIKDLVTSYGEKTVALPELSRFGYDFLGYQDQNGQTYEKTIDVNFKTVLELTALWKPKQVDFVIKDIYGNVLDTWKVEYGSIVELTLPILQEGQEFIEWQREGEVLTDTKVSVDTENQIVVLCMTQGGEPDTDIHPDDIQQPQEKRNIFPIVAVVVMVSILSVVGFIIIKRKRAHQKSNQREHGVGGN